MPVTTYDPTTGKWRKLNKEEVIAESVDIENKHPCDLCWEDARDNGIYAWPIKEECIKAFRRCSCGRVLEVIVK